MRSRTPHAALTACLLLVISLSNVVHAANILCLLGAPQPADRAAHQAWWHDTLLPQLVQTGHNVTVLTSIAVPSGNSDKLHFIPLPSAAASSPTQAALLSWWSISRLWADTIYERIVNEFSATSAADTSISDSPGVRQLLNNSGEFNFDLILHDAAQSAVLLGFVQHFGYPTLVSASAVDLGDVSLAAIAGAATYPAYVPHRWSAYDAPDDLTVVARTRNWSYYLFESFYRRYVYMRNANRKAGRVFGDDVQPLGELERRAELVLLNDAFGLDRARMLPPNVRPVGALQASRNATVSGELERFLATAPNGVVYVNLGALLEDTTRRRLTEAFALLPEYSFVWYTERLRLRFQPKNVFSSERYLPQATVLGHPNIRLMLTHGGRLSVQEAIWNAVPMLGLTRDDTLTHPLRRAQLAQCAEIMPLVGQHSAQIAQRIEAMLTNGQQYADAARKFRATVFGSPSGAPLATAVQSIEHVLSVGNARHLQLRNGHLYWPQEQFLDVCLVLFVLVVAFVVIFVKNCCRRKRTVVVTDDRAKTE